MKKRSNEESTGFSSLKKWGLVLAGFMICGLLALTASGSSREKERRRDRRVELWVSRRQTAQAGVEQALAKNKFWKLYLAKERIAALGPAGQGRNGGADAQEAASSRQNAPRLRSLS